MISHFDINTFVGRNRFLNSSVLYFYEGRPATVSKDFPSFIQKKFEDVRALFLNSKSDLFCDEEINGILCLYSVLLSYPDFDAISYYHSNIDFISVCLNQISAENSSKAIIGSFAVLEKLCITHNQAMHLSTIQNNFFENLVKRCGSNDRLLSYHSSLVLDKFLLIPPEAEELEKEKIKNENFSILKSFKIQQIESLCKSRLPNLKTIGMKLLFEYISVFHRPLIRFLMYPECEGFLEMIYEKKEYTVYCYYQEDILYIFNKQNGTCIISVHMNNVKLDFNDVDKEITVAFDGILQNIFLDGNSVIVLKSTLEYAYNQWKEIINHSKASFHVGVIPNTENDKTQSLIDILPESMNCNPDSSSAEITAKLKAELNATDSENQSKAKGVLEIIESVEEYGQKLQSNTKIDANICKKEVKVDKNHLLTSNY